MKWSKVPPDKPGWYAFRTPNNDWLCLYVYEGDYYDEDLGWHNGLYTSSDSRDDLSIEFYVELGYQFCPIPEPYLEEKD